MRQWHRTCNIPGVTAYNQTMISTPGRSRFKDGTKTLGGCTEVNEGPATSKVEGSCKYPGSFMTFSMSIWSTCTSEDGTFGTYLALQTWHMQHPEGGNFRGNLKFTLSADRGLHCTTTTPSKQRSIGWGRGYHTKKTRVPFSSLLLSH